MWKSLMLAGLLLATATPALAEDELTNNNLIEQVVDVKNTVEMRQRLAVGSIQAGNLVAAGDRLVNNGTIRQTFKAAEVRMEQRETLASTQALNAVVSGNPAASGLGY